MDVALNRQASVWFVDSDAITDERLAEYRAWLGADELLRCSRFVRRERQRQFVVGRVLLRQCLGAVLAVPTRDLRLAERAGQAPALDWPDCPAAGLSISHSANWVACAVSATTALGLDIERIDAMRDIGALAAQAFDAEQQAWLAARPASSRVRDFYQMWCEAEARIKLGGPAAAETALYHPAFAASLCSAQPFAGPPQLQAATLAS